MAAVPVILDTDMDFDVDDVGALCVLHALQDLGEAELIGVVHNAGYPKAIGAVSVLNHFYGRDDIPLGAFKGEFGRNVGSGYVDDLVDNYPSPVKHYDQVEEPLPVYRRALANAEDGTVAIASVGFMNNLAELLSSPPDEISELNGVELVRQKVSLVAIMGGAYPGGQEFNFDCGECCMGDAHECWGTARQAVDLLPREVKVVFSGQEVGAGIPSGSSLSHCAGDENPCRQAYIDYVGFGNTRSSWDPLTTLFAVRGASAVGCREEGYGGNNIVEEWGGNHWEQGSETSMSYLVLEEEEWVVGQAIDDLLCLGPGASTPAPTENPPPGGIISNPLTGLCLAVASDATTPTDYTNVRVDSCDTGKAERWQVTASGEIKHAASGHCLDEDANNENQVELYSCSGVAWQKWDLVGDTIVNRQSGRCLDIQNCPDGCEAGANVWTFDCYGGANQQWQIPHI